MTKLLQQCFLFFNVVVILWHNLGNSQVSVYRTIGPTLVFYCIEGIVSLVTREHGGLVVEPRTTEREVGGLIPTSAVLCP